MSEPKIVMTSTNGWDSTFIINLIDVARKMDMGEPFFKTEFDWYGRSRMVITFKKEKP